MNFLVLVQAIALWCGNAVPYKFEAPGIKPWLYSLKDVQECRDKMLQCVTLKHEGMALDFDIVTACFRSMSFGEIRKPVPVKK